MRINASSITMLLAPSQISHLEATLPSASPSPFIPFDPSAIPTVEPTILDPQTMILPLYDLLLHATPSSYARLFDQVSYGDPIKKNDKSTT
jgi:hypothetical protein